MDYSVSQLVKHSDVEKIDVPGLVGELYPFQHKGVAWMHAVKRGILADDVGLGKTVQAVATAALLKHEDALGNVLIVCPGGHERHWKATIEQFFPDVFEEVVNVSGLRKGKRRTKTERYDVYAYSPRIQIINYHILRNDVDFLEQFQWGLLTFDEATAFKNHETKLFDAVKRVTEGVPRVLALTATPFEKALIELHSIVTAMQMDIFGSIDEFRQHFEVIKWLETRQRHGPKKGRKLFVPKHIGYQNIDEFKEQIDPIYLRRDEETVEVDLPSVRTKQLWLASTGKQKAHYQSLVRDFQKKGDYGTFTRLLQSCDAPYVTSLSEDTHSPKAEELVRLVRDDFRDEKVVVFARWHRSIDVISLHLDEVNIPYVHYTGLQDEEERSLLKEQFINDPELNVLIMTTAGEKGVDGLQVAKGIIAFNQLYNPQRMRQVVGRLRRMGSEHKSIAYFNLMMEGSIEEKMWDLLMNRAELFDEVFDTRSTTELFEDQSVESAKRQVLRELAEEL